MSRELDAKVAEAMGLNLVRGQAPRYSEDIAAARTMEDWIEERGECCHYALAMVSVLHTDGFMPDGQEWVWWAMLHATPEQRCRAFLAAMGK